MELWIRSQNKDGLTKIYSINIEEKTSTKFSIVGNNEWILGIYETEERALEVLDDIQNFIAIEIHENNIDYEQGDLILKGKIVDSLCKIYQMPKE